MILTNTTLCIYQCEMMELYIAIQRRTHCIKRLEKL
nr:MAG TPA: hypothetical protein [Caudoviricetes sp.]